MYYYIFEPPHEAKGFERTSAIKERLASLGIAGEMVSPSPGRTIDDLVHLAIAKRYSTIVAVGDIEHANTVARAMEPYDAVFGIVPFKDHPDIAGLIGTSDWKAAAELLKRRRWISTRLGLINNSMCFITPLTVRLNGDWFHLTAPDFELHGSAESVKVIPYRGEQETSSLQIVVQPLSRRLSFVEKLRGMSVIAEPSRFVLPAFDLYTEPIGAVQVAGSDICSTPIRCSTQRKALKLIVATSEVSETE